MQYRPLGMTGIKVSAVSFGAGPVPALLTDPAAGERQHAAVRQALDAGVNWFDTAPTYGDGRSEAALGATLRALGAAGRVHVATKVRLAPERPDDIGGQVRESFTGSLRRLGLGRVTLLQLHNAVTTWRGDLPTSVTPDDVLGPGGVLEAFEALRRAGRVEHLGLTGMGDMAALRAVLDSGAFATVQVPYNLLIPRLRLTGSAGLTEMDDGKLMRTCAERGVGVIAIRVLAGGALALQPPSEHTLQTKFFPLALYDADRCRAEALAARLPDGMSLPEAAVRFVLARPAVATALVGFGGPEQVADAVRWAAAGPLPAGLAEQLVGTEPP
jgi:L-galactose dehydrogenase/L-glyceraldehyde 3-phosphate reductase